MDVWGETMGPEGTGHLMDVVERLLNLCAAERLEVGGSHFCQKNIHK